MLIARFIIETVNPMHCGGGTDPLLDQPVTRDAYGSYFIPGTSLAGILRQLAKDRFGPENEKLLFGELSSNKTESSSIWCSDAVVLDYDGISVSSKILKGLKVDISMGPFVRDHVRLDLGTDVTSRGQKFDEEIIPPGARFSFELRADEWNQTCLTQDVYDSFLSLCSSIRNNEISFGGKKTSGYGLFKCLKYEVCDIDRSEPSQMLSWLKLSQNISFQEVGLKTIALSDTSLKDTPSENVTGVLDVPLKSEGPLIVGGSNLKDIDSDIDMVCLCTPYYDYANKTFHNRYTIPGSSLRGVIRHDIYRIAKILKLDADELINSIFGKIDSNDEGSNSVAGKISVSDFYFDENVNSVQVQHVAIDRFTGGALEGALYDEKPVWSRDDQINLKINFKDLTVSETKLLLHAILDIATGLIPIGGGVNRGNGTLTLVGLSEGIQSAIDEIDCNVLWNGDVYRKGDLSMLVEMLDGE